MSENLAGGRESGDLVPELDWAETDLLRQLASQYQAERQANDASLKAILDQAQAEREAKTAQADSEYDPKYEQARKEYISGLDKLEAEDPERDIHGHGYSLLSGELDMVVSEIRDKRRIKIAKAEAEHRSVVDPARDAHDAKDKDIHYKYHDAVKAGIAAGRIDPSKDPWPPIKELDPEMEKLIDADAA